MKSCEAHALKDNAYVLRSLGLNTGESTHPGLASDLAALWGRRVFSANEVSPEESLSDSSACIVRSSDFGRPIRLRYFLQVKRADPVQFDLCRDTAVFGFFVSALGFLRVHWG